ncbi:MAG: NAD(+) kinase [Gammaproteobacteria bacterium]|nr:NAD(+) kinase [Gammaproteobacteria bacterium]
MAIEFKTIGIIGRLRNPGVKETLRTLITFLGELNLKIVTEAETAESVPDLNLTTVTREDLGTSCDLLIVIGGDGSLISATHAVVNHEIPVLGINRGSLGFLTDIHPTELQKIKAILNGEYRLEKRFLLNANIELQGEHLGNDDALNEVALIPNMVPHMIEFEIYIDDQFVCSQNSDGLIIATPTGSTAYALSGGGPILHPQLDAIVLVPMFPHTLSSRPIVIEGNQKIHIILSPHNTTSPRLSCDGQAYIISPPGSHITIQKKPEHLHLIHPLDYNYYETLRSKLHWGKKLQYSE